MADTVITVIDWLCCWISCSLSAQINILCIYLESTPDPLLYFKKQNPLYKNAIPEQKWYILLKPRIKAESQHFSYTVAVEKSRKMLSLSKYLWA